jgi:hypothetical protein
VIEFALAIYGALALAVTLLVVPILLFGARYDRFLARHLEAAESEPLGSLESSPVTRAEEICGEAWKP